jgi:hypothetical protein
MDDDPRAYAIERAELFIEQGHPPKRAAFMGMAQADNWDDDEREALEGLPSVHVVPVRDVWTVCRTDDPEMSYEFYHLDDAVRRAYNLGVETRTAVYVHSASGELVEKWEQFGRPVAAAATAAAAAEESAGEPDAEAAPPDAGEAEEAPAEEPEGVEVGPSDDGWTVTGQGPEESFSTKREAVKVGRNRAKEANAQLTIHYASGEVQKQVDYSED